MPLARTEKTKRGAKSKDKPVVESLNQSGIHPTEFKILVRPREIEEKTAGGIIIPLSEAEKLQNAAVDGTLIAVSPLAFGYERWPEGSAPPKVGDKVLYSKYAGMKRKGKDGVIYIVMQDKDLCAVLEE